HHSCVLLSFPPRRSSDLDIGLFFPIGAVFRHSHPAMAELEKPQVKEWAEINRPRVLKMLSFLDQELGQRRFIAGDKFTIADITADLKSTRLNSSHVKISY